MNDRYLFRGKRTDNGEWATGAYLERYHSTRLGTVDAIFASDENMTRRYPVYRGTVGQCTGCLDKHGARVFEGDVVKFEHPSPDVLNGTGVVAWNGEELAFEFSEPGAAAQYYGYSGDLYEIIGNVHDNPWLLGAAGI